jgi:putative nucleotidyltransferase with HDIG domain
MSINEEMLKSTMERFKEHAPGTYKHCQNVAFLCDSIAKELGINSEDLVMAATLHDIGKCFNPTYFIENIADGENPHDKLDPPISFQIISRHVSDSVLRLVQIGAPEKVIRIVSEHHGDTLVKVIFAKAKEKYNGGTVEEHYRYKSVTPTSVESAILMCADVVESATRALHNSGKLDDAKIVISRLLDGLIDDTQLDILKLGELRLIKSVLITEIKNMYHKRIDYDEGTDE